MTDIHNRVDFHYASTVPVTKSYIVSPLSTAAGGVRKKVRITDIKVSCTSARNLVIGAEGGTFRSIDLDLPGTTVSDLHWSLPYPLEAVSSTGEVRGIYASADGAGVKAVISGFIENFG